MTAALKPKAIILILLLVGNEAIRINTDVNQRIPDLNPEAPPDKQWQEINKARCSWRTWRGGCIGTGCTFRPLPLDRSRSDSCRLSTDYMLSNKDTQDSFSDLQTGILTEKAEKFKAHCMHNVSAIDLFSRPTMRCLRRASLMLQATDYIMKYEKSLLKAEDSFLSTSQGAKHQESIGKAVETLATPLGEDGRLFLLFRQKIMTHPRYIMQDPRGSVRMIGSVVSGLMSSNSSRKKQAQDFIERLPSGENQEELSQQDMEEISEEDSETHADSQQLEEDGERSLRVVEGALLGNDRHARIARKVLEQADETGDASGLIQIEHMQALRGWLANVGKVVLVILIALLIASIVIFLIPMGLFGRTFAAQLAVADMAGFRVLTFWYSAVGFIALWIRGKLRAQRDDSFEWGDADQLLSKYAKQAEAEKALQDAAAKAEESEAVNASEPNDEAEPENPDAAEPENLDEAEPENLDEAEPENLDEAEPDAEVDGPRRPGRE